MNEYSVEDLCGAIIFLRGERREIEIDLSRAEGRLIRHLESHGQRSIVVDGVRFERRKAKVATTPSKRRHWRALRPEGALDQWHQPEYLDVTQFRSALRRSA